LCLVSYANGGKGKIAIVAPPPHKMWHVDFCEYPDAKADPVSGRADGVHLASPDGRRIVWEVLHLLAQRVHEVRWSFDSTRATDPPCGSDSVAVPGLRT